MFMISKNADKGIGSLREVEWNKKVYKVDEIDLNNL